MFARLHSERTGRVPSYAERRELVVGKITLHNPQGPELVHDSGNPTLPRLRESTAGVLTNGKQNSELVMSAVLAVLQERFGVTPAVVCHTVSGVTNQDIIDELAAKCDWVFVGSSD